MKTLDRKEALTISGALVATLISGVLHYAHLNDTIVFIITGIALAALAALVGDAVDQLGGRLNPGATGVLQSALGNIPELFVGIFALRSGLVTVVQSALIGSILSNSLLVLGLAFLVGGLRHGTQRFSSESARIIVTLMLVAVASLIVPTLAYRLHTPASGHSEALSIAISIVLLVIFAVSIPFSIGGAASGEATEGSWPLWLAIAVLAGASAGAALVSDWFVEALRPATQALHISQAFTGLVIVAIAGNAVENVVGIQLAARNKADYAVSVILNSPMQIALGLTPILVLLSYFVGGAHLTLVMPALLVAAVVVATVISLVIVYDGESIWIEGAALIGLYGIIAAAFWWG